MANWYEEFEVLSRNYKKSQQTSSKYKVQIQELSQYSPPSSSSNNVFIPIKLSSTSNLSCSNSPKMLSHKKYTYISTFLKSPSNNNNNNNNNISLFDKYEIERISSQLDEYIESTKEKIKNSENKKLNILKGFLLFRYYKMMMNMCVTSSYDDVAVAQSLEKSPAPVVKFDSCRPWRKGS
ncbi:putative peptidyl-prolyl cis-trans isomerase PASTICCINO1-like [Capsicum annuum]|nr:putative peptidyl-prolyl cis-trans isomerase PASTICCINO1-like [Capsicum annuum]